MTDIINRRADSTLFGFEFQGCAAIVLFLENLKDIKSFRLEGNEDIDLMLDDNYLILAQAKSVRHPKEDFANVTSNLRKSLLSLSEASRNKKIRKLIYITNTIKPFGQKESTFELPSWYDYADLTKSERMLVDRYLSDIEVPLDCNSFSITVFPFDTDNPKERYKFIRQQIQDFLISLSLQNSVKSDDLLEVWKSMVLQSGTNHDISKSIAKKEMIWPLIAEAIKMRNIPDELSSDVDEYIYEIVSTQFKDFFIEIENDFEFVNKVLADYTKVFKMSHDKRGAQCLAFANNNWKKYIDDFKSEQLDKDANLKEFLIKLTLYRITINRMLIRDIKAEVGI